MIRHKVTSFVLVLKVNALLSNILSTKLFKINNRNVKVLPKFSFTVFMVVHTHRITFIYFLALSEKR